MTEKQKTYVYDGTEVQKTGREAVRMVKLPGKQDREFKKVEITPIEFGGDGWKKWVDPGELYEIVD